MAGRRLRVYRGRMLSLEFVGTESKPITVEELLEIAERFRAIPHRRVIVSQFVPGMRCFELPRYYDKRLCRDVETVVMSESFYERLRAETPVVEAGATEGMDNPYALRIEFSPPGWRPGARRDWPAVDSLECDDPEC